MTRSSPNEITLCVLTYGDHVKLARRCLDSIMGPGSPRPEFLHDVRIGMNQVCDETRDYVASWSFQVSAALDIPVTIYSSEQQFKYPMMRRMWAGPDKLAENVMWFDDDSYLSGKNDFWSRVLLDMTEEDMIGQEWQRRMSVPQWCWIQSQPWAALDVKLSDPPTFFFFTGGWWVIRRRLIEELDWPARELRHCGGDTMLGEAIRHVSAKTVGFDYGVHINADAEGSHSKAKRRGYTEKPFAHDWDRRPLPTDHQKFNVNWIRYHKGESTCGSSSSG